MERTGPGVYVRLTKNINPFPRTMWCKGTLKKATIDENSEVWLEGMDGRPLEDDEWTPYLTRVDMSLLLQQ
jgi:hypothetical protein